MGRRRTGEVEDEAEDAIAMEWPGSLPLPLVLPAWVEAGRPSVLAAVSDSLALLPLSSVLAGTGLLSKWVVRAQSGEGGDVNTLE